MNVAVIPPEYFPGIELAALALSADVLVLADTFQYVRQSRQNRARLRTPTGSQWVTIPLKGRQYGRPIGAIEMDPDADWRRVHPKALRFNYGGTAYFDHFEDAIRNVIMTPGDLLSSVSCASVSWLLSTLGSRSRLLRAGELPGRPGKTPSIMEAFPGATLLTTSGRAVTDVPRSGLRRVLEVTPFDYRQAFSGFVPGLSVLDLVLNLGPSAAQILAEHTRIVDADAELNPLHTK